MAFGPRPASAFKVIFDPLVWPEEFALNLKGFIHQEHGSKSMIEIMIPKTLHFQGVILGLVIVVFRRRDLTNVGRAPNVKSTLHGSLGVPRLRDREGRQPR